MFLFRIRVRKATIDAELRKQFELFGKEVVALALGLGQMPAGQFGGTVEFTGPTSRQTDAQKTIFKNQTSAVQWLQEKRDEDDLHQTVTLILEISITVLIVAEIVMRVLRIGA